MVSFDDIICCFLNKISHQISTLVDIIALFGINKMKQNCSPKPNILSKERLKPWPHGLVINPTCSAAFRTMTRLKIKNRSSRLKHYCIFDTLFYILRAALKIIRENSNEFPKVNYYCIFSFSHKKKSVKEITDLLRYIDIQLHTWLR